MSLFISKEYLVSIFATYWFIINILVATPTVLYLIVLWATGFLETSVGSLAPTILLKLPIMLHIILANIWAVTQIASYVPPLIVVHLLSFFSAAVEVVVLIFTLVDIIPGLDAGTTSPFEILFVSAILFVGVIVAGALFVTFGSLLAYISGFNMLVLRKRNQSAALAYEDEVYAQRGSEF